jgi:hypothetical protein
MPHDSAISITSAGTNCSAVETVPGHIQTPQLLTAEEIARLLRVDPSSVRRWRAARPPEGPPFIRMSERVVLYDAEDLRAWLGARRTTSGSR